VGLRWLRARSKRRVWMRVRPLATVRVDDFRLTIDLNDRVIGRML
jgi:hypothetical protein